MIDQLAPGNLKTRPSWQSLEQEERVLRVQLVRPELISTVFTVTGLKTITVFKTAHFLAQYLQQIDSESAPEWTQSLYVHKFTYIINIYYI